MIASIVEMFVDIVVFFFEADQTNCATPLFRKGDNRTHHVEVFL